MQFVIAVTVQPPLSYHQLNLLLIAEREVSNKETRRMTSTVCIRKVIKMGECNGKELVETRSCCIDNPHSAWATDQHLLEGPGRPLFMNSSRTAFRHRKHLICIVRFTYSDPHKTSMQAIPTTTTTVSFVPLCQQKVRQIRSDHLDRPPQ